MKGGVDQSAVKLNTEQDVNILRRLEISGLPQPCSDAGRSDSLRIREVRAELARLKVRNSPVTNGVCVFLRRGAFLANESP